MTVVGNFRKLALRRHQYTSGSLRGLRFRTFEENVGRIAEIVALPGAGQRSLSPCQCYWLVFDSAGSAFGLEVQIQKIQ
jgi:hypothetical protein